MQQPNPYAPPTASVADAQPPPVQSNPHVELACRLLWISIGLSLVESIAEFFRQPSLERRLAVLLGSLLFVGLGYLIVRWNVRHLRAAHNWMRWLATVIHLMAFVAVLWFYRNVLDQIVLRGDLFRPATLAIIPFLAGIAGVVMLHTPTSRAWFNAPSNAS